MTLAASCAGVCWCAYMTGRSAARRSSMTARPMLVPAGDDQKIRPGPTAGDGHDAEADEVVLTGHGRDAPTMEQVEIGDTLQRRPVDADVDHFAQGLSQGVGQAGQLACDRHRVWPPRPVEAAAQVGSEGEPDRTGRTSILRRASHAESRSDSWSVP